MTHSHPEFSDIYQIARKLVITDQQCDFALRAPQKAECKIALIIPGNDLYDH